MHGHCFSGFSGMRTDFPLLNLHGDCTKRMAPTSPEGPSELSRRVHTHNSSLFFAVIASSGQFQRALAAPSRAWRPASRELLSPLICSELFRPRPGRPVLTRHTAALLNRCGGCDPNVAAHSLDGYTNLPTHRHTSQVHRQRGHSIRRSRECSLAFLRLTCDLYTQAQRPVTATCTARSPHPPSFFSYPLRCRSRHTYTIRTRVWLAA